MTTDPVCGMELEEVSAAGEVDYEGTRYYFCSDTCRGEFLRAPEAVRGRGRAARRHALTGDLPCSST
jgi:YHS domain-containing protein